jgi:SAM-dependent methyltransferase
VTTVIRNPFVGASVAARYAAARPALHHVAVELLVARHGRTRRLALDVGCGTGLSTRALVPVAGLVIGVDISEDMLRLAERAAGERFARAAAERLPFPDGAFDLATVGSAVHWFASDGLEEIRRVLADDGELLIYDVWFTAEMSGEPGFTAWLERISEERYPPVDRNPRPDLLTMGFGLSWQEDVRRDVVMTLDELVAYLMTHSERIAAVESGHESEEEQRTLLASGVAPFFHGAHRRTLVFGIKVELFEPVS